MKEWKMPSDSNVTIKLDGGRDDANREGYHVNVYFVGKGRIGRITVYKWGGVEWTSHPSCLNHRQLNEIESFVRSIASEVIREYDSIRGN